MENNLPKGWAETAFTEALDIRGGTQPPKNTFKYEPTKGYIRLLQIRDFGEKPLPTYIKERIQLKTCNEDDILIARYGASIGRIVTGMTGAYNVALAKVIIPESISKNFIKYLLKSEVFQRPILSIQRSAQDGFNKDDLNEITISLPPLAEQHRIVAKLDAVFEKIESNKQRLDKIPKILKRFRQSVLADAVSGKLTEDWRVKNGVLDGKELLVASYKERLSKYKEETNIAISSKSRKPVKLSELLIVDKLDFDIPSNWSVTTPEFIAAPERYSLAIGPFGSNLKVIDYQDHGVPLVFVRHIKSNDFVSQNPKYVSIEKANELTPHKAYPLDLLITKMGEPPGDCEIYPENLPIAIITADCLRFKVWDKYFNRIYFKHLINSSIIKEQLGIITQGVAQQKISLERFKTLYFPIPPFEEQNEIVRRTEHLFAFADKLESRYVKAKGMLDKLPQSILAKAFRGELVAQDSRDEPASVLLERIAEAKQKGKVKGKAVNGAY